MLNINFKKLDSNAVVPTKAHADDAGFDLVAVSRIDTGDYIEFDTGIAVEIPKNHVGLVFPRSSVSKYDLQLANAVAVIDCGYTDSIKLRFKRYINPHKTVYELVRGLFKTQAVNPSYCFNEYQVGDRIGQLIIMPYPEVSFTEVKELAKTERGEGGFGSTDETTTKVKRRRSRKKV